MEYVSHCFRVLWWNLVAFLGLCLSVVTLVALVGFLLLLLLSLTMLVYILCGHQDLDTTKWVGTIDIGLCWKVLFAYFTGYYSLGVLLMKSLRPEETWSASLTTILAWPAELAYVALCNIDRS